VTAVAIRSRTVSWTGTLPPVESVAEHTERFLLPRLEPPPPRQPAGWRNDLATMRKLLDGLVAL
jgi:hypothetical protein